MGALIKIGKSKIAGKGVFATSAIKKGRRICFLTGELCTLNGILKKVYDREEKSSDPLGVDVEEYIDLDELPRTFNHSCNPNAFIRGKNELVALKDIKKGEEITYDYSSTMNDNEAKIKKAGFILWTCKCNCGADNCRKIIDQFKTLPAKRRKIYITNKFMPDFTLKYFKART